MTARRRRRTLFFGLYVVDGISIHRNSRVPTPYNSAMDGSYKDEDPTPPLGLRLSDRMILERAIQGVHEVIRQYIDEQREQTAKFYSTRLMPLEAQVVKLTTVAWFALGIAASALFLGAVLMIAMVAR